MIRQLDERASVSGQIAPEDIPGLADAGITLIVNNRPDGEEPDQPTAAEIEQAVRAAGLDYRFVPIMRGIGPADVEAMREAIDATGAGRMLAYCRSGTRSALVVALAQRHGGAGREQVIDRLQEAGFDPAPIAHLL